MVTPTDVIVGPSNTESSLRPNGGPPWQVAPGRPVRRSGDFARLGPHGPIEPNPTRWPGPPEHRAYSGTPGPKRAPGSLAVDPHEFRIRASEETPVTSLQANAVEAPEYQTRAVEQPARLTVAATADPVVKEARSIRTQFSLNRHHVRSSQAGSETRFYGGLVGLFVVHLTIWLALWSVVPALAFGWSPLVLTSDSMAPTLRTGDVVIAAPHDGSVLGAGTVVLFDDPAGTGQVTHRIMSVGEDGTYITRGDANRLQDSTPLPAEDVVGVGRILVPLIGSPLVWWWTGTWWKVALWLAGTVLCVWLSRYALLPAFTPWGQQSDAT